MQTKTRGRQPDPEARAARKESIMLAAHKLFRQKGFDSASTAEISKAADISVAGLYQYFSSKDELIAALIERELAIAMNLLDKLSRFEDFFVSLDEVYFEMTRDEGFGLGSGLRMEIYALATRSEAISKLVGKLEETMVAIGTEVIAKAQIKGQIDPTLDPAYVSKMLSCTTEGLLVQMCLPKEARKNFRLATMDLIRRALAPR